LRRLAPAVAGSEGAAVAVRAGALVVLQSQLLEVLAAPRLLGDVLGILPGQFPVREGAGVDEDVLPLDAVADLELVGVLLVVLQDLLVRDAVPRSIDPAAHVLHGHEAALNPPADAL